MPVVADRLRIGLQQDLITLLCFDDEHGKIIASTMDPTIFDGDYRDIATRAVDYWKTQGRAPGKGHIGNVLDDLLDDERRKHGIHHILKNMLLLNDHINPPFVLQSIDRFTQSQKLKDAICRVAELLGNGSGNNKEVVSILAEALRGGSSSGFDPGRHMGDTAALSNYLSDNETDEFNTGIPVLDQRHVVPKRKRLMVLLGVLGTGKSWALMHLGVQAMLLHKQVVHVTLELSADELQVRYWQNHLAVPQQADTADDLVAPCTTLKLDQDNRLIGLEPINKQARFSLNSQSALQEISRLTKGRGGWFDKLIIKEYPMCSLSMAQLGRYLAGLEAVECAPDLLLLDYLKVMRIESDDIRIALGRTLEQLRGLAQERNIAVVTAHQINREGAKAKDFDLTHISEDFSLAMTADTVISLHRNELEEKHGLARLYVDKNRNGTQKFGAVITQNLKHGIFASESTWLDRAGYADKLEQHADKVAGDAG